MKAVTIRWKNGGYSMAPSITRARVAIRALRPYVNFIEVDGVRQPPEYLDRFSLKPSKIPLGFYSLINWDWIPITKETFEGINTLEGMQIALFWRTENGPYSLNAQLSETFS